MTPSLLFLNRDAKILHLMRKGDEEALVMLYRDTRAMVASYITRNSGSPDDTEDMLQEALVILWERVRSGKFEHTAKLSTFVFATVRNLWSRRLARMRRETALQETADPPANDPLLLDNLIEKEQHELLRQAMTRIGELCRQLLLLFYWEERPMEEIASRLGFANADTAKSKKYQCKKNLERILKSLMDHE
ncbi:MAG: sigma-70 family RNA polymerase sigma factor [Ignavibacteriales bacterium]|nr:sigma-70 family RNA polymerase sigma factor [Ignavibacteriales bacterium]